MRYALISPQNSISRFAEDIDLTAQVKSGWKWLRCPRVPQPAYDPLAETVDGPSFAIGAIEVSESYIKRPLTAQEISDRKDSAVNALNGGGNYMPILRALHNLNNRVLTLEAKPTLTMPQFKAVLKALI